MKTSVIIGVT